LWRRGGKALRLAAGILHSACHFAVAIAVGGVAFSNSAPCDAIDERFQLQPVT
jgi:hypothetical protein